MKQYLIILLCLTAQAIAWELADRSFHYLPPEKHIISLDYINYYHLPDLHDIDLRSRWQLGKVDLLMNLGSEIRPGALIILPGAGIDLEYKNFITGFEICYRAERLHSAALVHGLSTGSGVYFRSGRGISAGTALKAEFPSLSGSSSTNFSFSIEGMISYSFLEKHRLEAGVEQDLHHKPRLKTVYSLELPAVKLHLLLKANPAFSGFGITLPLGPVCLEHQSRFRMGLGPVHKSRLSFSFGEDRIHSEGNPRAETLSKQKTGIDCSEDITADLLSADLDPLSDPLTFRRLLSRRKECTETTDIDSLRLAGDGFSETFIMEYLYLRYVLKLDLNQTAKKLASNRHVEQAEYIRFLKLYLSR